MTGPVRKVIRLLSTVLVGSLTAVFLGVSPTVAVGAHREVDIDGDGLSDWVIGAPGETKGAVYIQYGDGRRSRLGGEAIPGALSVGGSLATCDITGDGLTDVVAGDLDATLTPGSSTKVGGFALFYGTPGGPTSGTLVTQATISVPGAAEQGDDVGYAVACGNINGDGYDDVLVGSPGEDVGTVTDAGAVLYFFGAPSGLNLAGKEMHQDTIGVPSVAERTDHFGTAVAIGDVTGDGFGEMVVGSVGEDNWGGMVHSFRGTSTGWTATGTTTISAVSLTGASGLGGALTVGQFDGAYGVDIAVSQLGVGGFGRVTVIRGKSTNLSVDRATTFDQDSPGVPDQNQTNDWFGYTLAAGDIDGNGYDELVVGNPHESFATAGGAGTVTILRGSATGITSSGAQYFSQDTVGVPGKAQQDDRFGWGVGVADVNHDSRLDLLVGSAFEAVGTAAGAGTLTVLPGSASGVTTTGYKLLTAATFGGVPALGAVFGMAATG